MDILLSQLLSDVPLQWESNGIALNTMVNSVEFDSREVKAGSIFVAFVGNNVDGHKYIRNAVEKGASAVFGTQSIRFWLDLKVPYFQVEDSRTALGYLSAAFYGFPARSMTIIGVTGTDGKTTTSNLIYQILKIAGFKVGMISTVNAQIGEEILDTGFHVTTPEAPSIQFYLNKMKEAGITHVILETTSHGLAQGRVIGCEFDIGVVTNITHEHLDFHGSYAQYLIAKARLFEMLLETGEKKSGNIRLAVINKDDISYPVLSNRIKTKLLTYAVNSTADIWAEDIRYPKQGIDFVACSKDFRVDVHCNISGEFNVANSLAALAVCIFGLKISPEIAASGISALDSVPGRMQQIYLGQEFQAIVDFAHTPNALEKALLTARKMAKGRIIAIFGSAGLRDKEKRRLMAAVSTKFSDITIVTAEDPRTENLLDILAEMRDEAIKNGATLDQNLFIIPDRGKAIQKGVQLAKDDDLVIACGKGHEQSMCFGEVEYPWDDRIAMKAALADLLHQDGPEMPYLPTQE